MRGKILDIEEHFYISCPHCTSILGWSKRNCCICLDKRIISYGQSLEYIRNVWSREECKCGTCSYINIYIKKIWHKLK